MTTSLPAYYATIPNDGSGPSIGINVVSDPIYTQKIAVGGTPSIVPGVIWRSPAIAYAASLGDIAHQIQALQHGHPDLYSWRVASPPIPYRVPPKSLVASQIHYNRLPPVYTNVASPPIPTAGAGRR